jgi:hypothetical protein
MKKIVFLAMVALLILAGCGQPGSTSRGVSQPASSGLVAANQRQSQAVPPAASATLLPPATSAPAAAASAAGKIPNFDHIVLIVLENEYLQSVIGSAQMPNLNALAQKYVLLSNYSAVTHPSLPNYLALVSGSTQDITSDCNDCFVNQPNLADEIETSGRTWKSYQESMPSACFIGNTGQYAQFTNPFIYFDSIRLDAARCERSIVPLTQLDTDLVANALPNFVFIMPDKCDSGHDCSAETADGWLSNMVAKLQASPALGQNSLIIVTFDEGVKRDTSIKTRGQVATLLISPLAQAGFNDSNAYSHYSLLKTILVAWNLPDLGQTKLPSTALIVAPWVVGANDNSATP